jgi:hypothetical protein
MGFRQEARKGRLENRGAEDQLTKEEGEGKQRLPGWKVGAFEETQEGDLPSRIHNNR